MSHHRYNFTPLSRQRGLRSYDGHTYNHHESNEVPVFFRSNSSRATQDERTSDVLPRQRVWEFRHPVGFHHSIPHFPTAAPRRQEIHIHNENMGRLRDIFLQQPSRYTFQTSTQAPPVVEISKSTALNKLQKVVYGRKLNLYYRNNAEGKTLKQKEKEKDEDGKRCAICLEDFKTGEEVMLTPCKHMFHEDCIVPWLTTKGQCPVCRSVICEMGCGNPSSFSNNDLATLESSNLFDGEFLSVFRAMEETFQLGSMT